MEFVTEQIILPPDPEVPDSSLDTYKKVKGLISTSFATCSCNISESSTFKELYATEGKFKNLISNFKMRYNVDITLEDTKKWERVSDLVNFLKNKI